MNQIVYTTNDGQARVLFDEKLSHRGAKLCIAKKKRAQDLTEMNVNLNVVVPFQPKNFRDVNKAVSARDTLLSTFLFGVTIFVTICVTIFKNVSIIRKMHNLSKFGKISKRHMHQRRQ